jgi:hypothetical protein
VKPDPAFHQQRGQFFIRTTNCKRQAPEDEPAVIVMASLSNSTALLVFGPDESWTVTNASKDRGVSDADAQEADA